MLTRSGAGLSMLVILQGRVLAGGKLVPSVAHPRTVFLIAPVDGESWRSGVMRSDDDGATWTWASPREAPFGVPALDVYNVVDGPTAGTTRSATARTTSGARRSSS